VFIEDPSGVTIELNYPAAEVAGLDIPGNGARALRPAVAGD
jgi:hypothetical protein